MLAPGDLSDLPGWVQVLENRGKRRDRPVIEWHDYYLPHSAAPLQPSHTFPGTNRCSVLLHWVRLMTRVMVSTFIIPPSVTALLIKIQFAEKSDAPSIWPAAHSHMVLVCKHKHGKRIAPCNNVWDPVLSSINHWTTLCLSHNNTATFLDELQHPFHPTCLPLPPKCLQLPIYWYLFIIYIPPFFIHLSTLMPFSLPALQECQATVSAENPRASGSDWSRTCWQRGLAPPRVEALRPLTRNPLVRVSGPPMVSGLLF